MDFDFGKVFSPQYLPALALAVGSGMKAAGIMGVGQAGVQAAQRRQQAAQFEADQLRVNAGQAKAASQRDAYFKGLEADKLISAIRARAGAGGSDPTVLNLIAEASARKAFNMQAALYGGEDKARLMRMQASGKEFDAATGMADAKKARNAYNFQALSTVVSGGAEIYSKSLKDKYWPKDSMLVPEAERPQVVGEFNTYGPDVDWTQ